MPWYIWICVGIVIGWALDLLVGIALGAYGRVKRHRQPRRAQLQEILDEAMGKDGQV